ncbi:SDR family NAD(P)-dependent oxidoreductase [Aliirhizobium smilacinae]|uniref:SDR family NAD(P)-dependent oxidoreductase n=1 Tax=Aliirhizobium smilacinae TaxID=1395944 RepID=A0A5C4XNX8_9HYPH|nr:SDR family NAD(P)-dependent oxidoreductase [Rhizobium smilacinae]TNM65226.1 SDR family NAD(P)-dependent oxidoreductase [Rhizobium smilacinae]
MKRDTSISWQHRNPNTLDLNGLQVAIVGGTGGIGRSFAQDLARQGANVTVVGQTFKDQSIRNIRFMTADLSSMAEAKRVAAELPAETLDLVIMTTGIMAGPKRQVIAEGVERDLAISYLSRYVILKAIAHRLGVARAEPRMKPRVFVMGFPGSGQKANVEDLNSERGYGRMKAHMNTVAGNEALVLDAARRYPQIDVFGLNPGFVKTGIRENLFGTNRLLLSIIEGLTSFMTVKPEVYSERMVPLLVSPDLEGRSGAMFNNKAQAILPSPAIANVSMTGSIIAATETLLGKI